MTYFSRLATLCLLIAPIAGFAHPGHFDFAPAAHDAAHAIPYLFVLVAIVLAASRLHRTLRAKTRRSPNIK